MERKEKETFKDEPVKLKLRHMYLYDIDKAVKKLHIRRQKFSEILYYY